MIEVERGKPIWAMGLMSGTSMDGVDAALLKTDGESIAEFGPGAETKYVDGDMACVELVARHPSVYRQASLGSKYSNGIPSDDEGYRAELHEAESDVVSLHAKAVLDLVAMAERSHGPSIIGFHGQTVAHAPKQGWTWQLGDGGELARILNRPVVWDFRTDDMKAGGEGAPLAPFFHFALARHIGATEPLAFLNLGGVGNATWVDPKKLTPEEEGALVAFDTGPGNALINDWMHSSGDTPLDQDGAAAATGTVQHDRLSTNSGMAYLDRRPPKSLDRNDFHGILNAMQGLSINDGAATLTAFTADCVAESLRHMPSAPARWLVCGGGRHNHTMMQMLQNRLNAPVEPVEAVGLDGDMLEAQAFAYLAVRVLRGLPTSAPSTTGCREPVCGGRINYPT